MIMEQKKNPLKSARGRRGLSFACRSALWRIFPPSPPEETRFTRPLADVLPLPPFGDRDVHSMSSTNKLP